MRTLKRLNDRGWSMDGIMRDDVRQACKYPLRQAIRYTRAEDRDVVAQFELGFSVSEIAEWHQRTEGGVSARLARLGHLSGGW